MIVAGVMSGTSADGINVALVRFPARGPKQSQRALHPRQQSAHTRSRTAFCDLLAHEEFPFPAQVRRTILRTMNAELASVADLARLNFLLAELYAEAIAKTARRHRIRPDLVGCHGQTIYHQGTAQPFLGRKLAVTWQTGEGSVIAARLGVPVVSDFRPADMAAGGKGAPLVPFLDYALYRSSHRGRIALNIGGIANLTAIPAAASSSQIIAFDTGPGNMVIDGVMEELFQKRYDRAGRIAASGQALQNVIARSMAAPFFRQRPPRTAGREQFGREFVARFLQLCHGARKPDIVATAALLTARSIADALRRFVIGRDSRYRELIVSGGGTKNPTLISMLRDEIAPLGIALHSSDDFGIPPEAKEAVAFALLAYQTWHRQPANVPSATGAWRPAILGKISYV